MHGRDPRSVSSGATPGRITKGFARRIYLSARSESTNVVIPHFFTEEAAMKLSFAVLLAVANGAA